MNSLLAQSLHPLERKLLLEFKRTNKNRMLVDDLVGSSDRDRTGMMRASEWLRKRDLIVEERTELHKIKLSERGKYAIKISKLGTSMSGLPERLLARKIADKGSLPIRDLFGICELTKEEYRYGFGFLKNNRYIEIQKGNVSLSPKGTEFLIQSSPLEEALQRISQGKEIIEENMTEIDPSIIQALFHRGLVTRNTYLNIVVVLTEKGLDLLPLISEELEVLEELTSDILISNKWQDHIFRPYDINAPVLPRIPGKRHYYRQVTDYIRDIWLSLGFEEMTGSIIQPCFWNFDALFVPQDHPAREMQDTFYMKQPAFGKLPSANLVTAVRQAHENGGNTGSEGWKYKWSVEEAKKNVLRPHTTVLSARTLARLREEDQRYPRKFFSLGRNFRNETITWKHLAEFDQTDGIVVDPDATFRHLVGYLKTFFSRLGFPKARFRPGYFPYTEPSLEIDVYYPARKEWVEFGGAGVFRPEVVIPLLGEDVPVLAWGPGLRMIMDHYKIDDMRRYYESSLGFLRNAKLWMEV